MRKRILCSILSLLLVFSLSSCAPKVEKEKTFDSFTNAIDTEFSEAVMTHLSELGDDPDTGNRSAGSPAEHQAADYLITTMKEMGLSNVTKEAAKVDGWTYRGANLTYKDANGQDTKIVLGGYQTELKATDEQIPLVYLGKGTAADYEGVDVKGKLVLIDIDQNNDWWINYPAYQAKLKGAKAVIAMSILPTADENRISSQDICGPADAPAFAISQKDSLALRALLKASPNGEITVTLNADSTIKPNSTTYNVWGEIPGKTDEVIYLFGHYDGYYHSSYDDASGLATALGIAKAIIGSGYKPDKTICIIAHGAEEWGYSDSAYDWSCGAYQQIMVTHPEWAQKGFAIINIDGGYPVQGETRFGISTSNELQNFTQKSTSELIAASGYKYTWTMPAGDWTEDFQWTAQGIPSIVAGDDDNGIYENGNYHSSTDSVSALPLDTDMFRFNHELYGKILLDLDALAVRPMDFSTRFSAMAKSVDPAVVKDTELMSAIKEAKDVSKKLTEKINNVNEEYAKAMADLKAAGDDDNKAAEATQKIDAIKAEASVMNSQLFSLYKEMQDDFLRLNWALDVTFPHETYQSNVKNLRGAIAALKEGNIPSAYDEYLPSIDYASYAASFDKPTYDYFVNQVYDHSKGTFGAGRIPYPGCDLYGVVQSLGAKYDKKNANTSVESAKLSAELVKQQDYLAKTIAGEKVYLTKLTAEIESMTK